MSRSEQKSAGSENNSTGYITFGLYLVVASFLLAGAGALASFYPIRVSVLLNIVFPIIVMWLIGMVTRFGYIKLGTLVVGRFLIVLAALGLGEEHIGWICLLLLQLNIVEAMLLDLVNRNIWNALNALLLLLSSLLMSIGFSGAYVFIEPPSWLLWIIAYTVWNALFVLKNLPAHQFVAHFVILLAPLLFCAIWNDSSYWLVLRETTLLLGITVIACIRERFEPYVYGFVSEQALQKLAQKVYSTSVQAMLFLSMTLIILIQCFSL